MLKGLPTPLVIGIFMLRGLDDYKMWMNKVFQVRTGIAHGTL
jgi:hypothetical protein